MRLSHNQTQTIHNAVLKHFGINAKVWLISLDE